MKQNWKTLLAVILGVIIVIALVMWATGNGNQTQAATSKLTGLEVETSLARRPVLAVIYDNLQPARPQVGIDSAGVVFETVTEGGITRYLALFQDKMPDEVGSIRSLRTFFLNWATGFDASIAHVGGSAEALQFVEQRDAKSLNEFDHSEPYFRVDNRPAPHNMFVSTSELRDLQEQLEHRESQFEEFPRSDDNPSQNTQAPTITIDYSSPAYLAEFRYQQSDNTYVRYLAGNPHVDGNTNQPVSVSNVVVIRVPESGAGDALGSGEALVFKDGNVLNARWRKTDFSKRIEIIDSGDNQVPLNKGDTWFAALPEGRPLNY